MNRALPAFLQELFDRGVDPLDDPRARAWLEQHPEQLPAFASLRALVREVRAVPPAMTWPRRRWPLWLMTGAAGVLAAIAVWWLYASAVPGSWSPPSAGLPRPLFAPRSQVRSSATSEERIVAGSRQFVFATVQGTLSQKASTTRSMTSTEPQLPTVFLRTTVFDTTIRP